MMKVRKAEINRIFRYFVRQKSKKASNDHIVKDHLHILKRIQVIDNTEKCREITEKIKAEEKVIGVDAEAVQTSPGLVQVGTGKGDIFLFRTGINQDLFKKGGIQNLMENQTVLKVFHDSGQDCLSFAKAGIRIDPLFDTSIVHRVVRYQNTGDPFNNFSMGFNKICQEYSLPLNPLKDFYEGFQWTKTEKLFGLKKDLTDDLKIYCAYDVIPLINLYDILESQLEKDFAHLHEKMVEINIIRGFDRFLANKKVKKINQSMRRNLFLSGLKMSSKYDLYEKMSGFEEDKIVLFNKVKNTAHVIFEDSNIANEASKYILKNIKLFGPEAKMRFVLADENELKPADQSTKDSINEKFSSYKDPLVTQFIYYNSLGTIGLEINGKNSVNFKVQNIKDATEMLKIFSDPKVTKIVPRMGTQDFLLGYKSLKSEGIEFENVFDIVSAVKVCDYFYHGKSITKSNCMSIKDLLEKFNISENGKEDVINLHSHLVKIMPPKTEEIFQKLMDLDLVDDKKVSKKERKDFQEKYETSVLHVSVNDELVRKEDLSKFVSKWLMRPKILHEIIVKAQNVVIVKIKDENLLEKARDILEIDLKRKFQQFRIVVPGGAQTEKTEMFTFAHIEEKI